MANKYQKVRFLSDEPAEKDYFETHTQVARAISYAIRENEHLRVIGLLGRWGSGKSTVVGKLEEKLEDEEGAENIVFFTYDAWLNQSDPQRRAFLETFVKFLTKRSIIDEKKWTVELKRLAGTIEDSETIENPVFSTYAKVFALSLIIPAIFLQLLNLETMKALFENPVSPTVRAMSPKTPIGAN